MIYEPTIENLKRLDKSYLEEGAKDTFDFPYLVDNTMRCNFRSCPQKFFKRDILRRTGSAESIHLVAGKALAEGLDVVRKERFGASKTKLEDAVARGFIAFTKTYGYDNARDNDEAWADSPKAYIRMAEAFLAYWQKYSGNSSPGGTQHIMEDGTVASEQALTIELDVLHPVTGKPLLYHVRCDAMEDFNGGLWLVDEKTTGSLGPSWLKQWNTRSQFMGYTYVFRKAGYPVIGVITRGIGILKTKITHMQEPVSFSDSVLEKWWRQVNRDFSQMVAAWKLRQYDYDFADACNTYGKCDYATSCIAKFEHKELQMMPIRIWRPDAPELSITHEVI